MCCAPSATARRPAAADLVDAPGGAPWGRPALICAWRAGFWPWPAVSTWPRIVSETSPGSTPARSSAALIAAAPSSCAGVAAKEPLKLPTARAGGRCDYDIGHPVSPSSWRPLIAAPRVARACAAECVRSARGPSLHNLTVRSTGMLAQEIAQAAARPRIGQALRRSCPHGRCVAGSAARRGSPRAAPRRAAAGRWVARLRKRPALARRIAPRPTGPPRNRHSPRAVRVVHLPVDQQVLGAPAPASAPRPPANPPARQKFALRRRPGRAGRSAGTSPPPGSG